MTDFDRFVDGYIHGVIVDIAINDKLTVFLSEPTGNKWKLIAQGVEDFIVSYMGRCNIIHQIDILDRTIEDLTCREKIFFISHGEYPNKLEDFFSPCIDSVMEKIKSGDLMIIEIEPVCGAYILILTKEIIFEQ
jgi:hypothetical protein